MKLISDKLSCPKFSGGRDGMYNMMMEYYYWTRGLVQSATKTADTAGQRLHQLISTAVRGWTEAGASLHQCETASLGLLSLARDVTVAAILLHYKLFVITYR